VPAEVISTEESLSTAAATTKVPVTAASEFPLMEPKLGGDHEGGKRSRQPAMQGGEKSNVWSLVAVRP
jgi:hypothetical protein